MTRLPSEGRAKPSVTPLCPDCAHPVGRHTEGGMCDGDGTTCHCVRIRSSIEDGLDGGPWQGPTTAEWVERIARGSTPVREYVDGKFQSWIDTRPTTRLGRNDDLADGTGTPSRSRDASARTGSPDGRCRPPGVTPRSSGTPSRGVTPAASG